MGVVSVVLTPTTGYTSSITTPTYPNSTLPPRFKREGKARANSVFGDFFSMRSIFGDPVVFWEEDRDLTLKQEEGLKTVCFMCPKLTFYVMLCVFLKNFFTHSFTADAEKFS